jgi:hypothetical protein
MLNPMTTGLQVAHHDAWLAEMQKEPSPEVGQVAQLEAEGRVRKGLASRLAGVAKRLRSRSWPAAPRVPDAPTQTKGASA